MRKGWAVFVMLAALIGLGLFAPARSVRAELVCDGDAKTGFVCSEQGSVCTVNCGQDAAGGMRSSCAPGQNYSEQSVSRPWFHQMSFLDLG